MSDTGDDADQQHKPLKTLLKEYEKKSIKNLFLFSGLNTIDQKRSSRKFWVNNIN